MRRTLFATLFLAGALGAQSTVVVPGGFANKEGGSYFWVLGQYTVARVQQLYAKSAMPSTPIVIKSFKIRRNGTSSGTFIAHTFDMEVYMSNRNQDPPAGCGFGWAGNHGTDLTKVMNKKSISWPATPKPTTPPAPFTVAFPMDKPFPYKGKSFAIEFKNIPPANVTTYRYYWYTDAQYYSTSAGWSYPKTITPKNIGKSCRPKGATSDPRNYGYYPYPGSPFHFYSYWYLRKANIPALLFIGSSDKKWGAINLPFDLTPLGAPGCNLYVDMVTAYVSKTDKNGKADFNIGAVPNDPTLTGQVFYNQQFLLDSASNSMGVVSTYGRKYTIGTGFTGKCPGFCFYTYKYSASSTLDPNAPTAAYYTSRANIIELTY